MMKSATDLSIGSSGVPGTVSIKESISDLEVVVGLGLGTGGVCFNDFQKLLTGRLRVVPEGALLMGALECKRSPDGSDVRALLLGRLGGSCGNCCVFIVMTVWLGRLSEIKPVKVKLCGAIVMESSCKKYNTEY
jgi:hypothetical protein